LIGVGVIAPEKHMNPAAQVAHYPKILLFVYCPAGQFSQELGISKLLGFPLPIYPSGQGVSV